MSKERDPSWRLAPRRTMQSGELQSWPSAWQSWGARTSSLAKLGLLKESVDDRLDEAAVEELLSCTIMSRSIFVSCTCMIWCASHAVQFMSLSTLSCFPSSSFCAICFFSRLEDVASWLAGGNELSECPGSKSGRPYYVYAPRGACVFRLSFIFLLCLFSALVRTSGCLPPSPSFVLAEALHVGFFFFSSLVIHIPLLLSSCLSLLKWLRLSRQAVKFGHVAAFECFNETWLGHH